MKNSSLVTLAVAALALCSCCNCTETYPTTFAHRGCWIENYIPENSIDGVAMAARYGYPTIECDIKFTSDSVLVLMHDKSINRTMRNAADYSPIEEQVIVKDTPFNVLRDNYIFASDTLSCRKQIPTFAEYMDACEEYGILPILHCDIYEGYVAAKERLGSGWIAFTEDYELCLKVRELDSDVLILYSPKKPLYDSSAEFLIGKLDSIGGRCGISSMHYPLMRKGVCDSLRTAGYTTQSSIFPIPHEMEAISNGADIILSDFCWFPLDGVKPSSTFSAKNKKEFSKEFGKVKFATMTLRISCKGAYELTVNGNAKKYTIDNDGEEILLGYRMYETVPSIVLEPVNPEAEASIKYVKVELFDL